MSGNVALLDWFLVEGELDYVSPNVAVESGNIEMVKKLLELKMLDATDPTVRISFSHLHGT